MSFSYKSSITFGLVYIPIKLQNVIKENDIGFNMIDKKSKSRISYKKVAVETGEEVQKENIIKGFQYEKDKYVIFENEDFEKLKKPKDKTIVIENFVDSIEIDSRYYEKAYYVLPNGAEKAYLLLKEALKRENKVGIAKTVLGTKENVVAIRVINDELVLNTMYFATEIRNSEAKKIDIDLDEKELKLAQMIINNMSTKFEPQKYKDEYNIRLQEAIERKIKGKEITITKEADDFPAITIDLMEALENTLRQNSVVSK